MPCLQPFKMGRRVTLVVMSGSSRNPSYAPVLTHGFQYCLTTMWIIQLFVCKQTVVCVTSVGRTGGSSRLPVCGRGRSVP